MSDKELFAMDADRVAQRALELHERASMPLSEALALAINEAAPGPIWPIARLFIDSAGNVCSDSHLYAPGLPEGEHDVYPLPVDSGARPAAREPWPFPSESNGALEGRRQREAAEKRAAGVDASHGGQQ